MPCTATYDDANLILKLYDMRREARLREARAWFTGNFKPKSMDEAMKLCPHGSPENASMRMVVTYWDMVGSFVTSGVLNQELFFQSGRELLFVYARIGPLLPEYRAAFKDPLFLRNFETVAKLFIEWMDKQDPEIYKAFKARVTGA